MSPRVGETDVDGDRVGVHDPEQVEEPLPETLGLTIKLTGLVEDALSVPLKEPVEACEAVALIIVASDGVELGSRVEDAVPLPERDTLPLAVGVGG